jgi:hypothetical protein
MVRRGSTVRVRQRASRKGLQIGRSSCRDRKRAVTRGHSRALPDVPLPHACAGRVWLVQADPTLGDPLCDEGIELSDAEEVRFSVRARGRRAGLGGRGITHSSPLSRKATLWRPLVTRLSVASGGVDRRHLPWAASSIVVFKNRQRAAGTRRYISLSTSGHSRGRRERLEKDPRSRGTATQPMTWSQGGALAERHPVRSEGKSPATTPGARRRNSRVPLLLECVPLAHSAFHSKRGVCPRPPPIADVLSVKVRNRSP